MILCSMSAQALPQASSQAARTPPGLVLPQYTLCRCRPAPLACSLPHSKPPAAPCCSGQKGLLLCLSQHSRSRPDSQLVICEASHNKSDVSCLEYVKDFIVPIAQQQSQSSPSFHECGFSFLTSREYLYLSLYCWSA